MILTSKLSTTTEISAMMLSFQWITGQRAEVIWDSFLIACAVWIGKELLSKLKEAVCKIILKHNEKKHGTPKAKKVRTLKPKAISEPNEQPPKQADKE